MFKKKKDILTLQQLYKCSYNAAKKKRNPTQIHSSTDEYDYNIVKKLLSIKHNSQDFSIIQFPIKHRNITMYYIFKTVQVTKSLQMSQVNSPRVECQIPDIGMTAGHAENYNLNKAK